MREAFLLSTRKGAWTERARPVLQTHWTSGRSPSPGMYTPMPKTWGGLPGAPAHTQGLSTKSDQADTIPNIQSAHAVRRLVHLEVCTYSQQPRHLEDRSQLWRSSVDAFRLGDPVPMCHKRHIPGDNVDQAMQFTGWESQNWILFPSICLKATLIKPHLHNCWLMQPLLGCAAKRYTWLYLLYLCCLPHSLSLSPTRPLLSQ